MASKTLPEAVDGLRSLVLEDVHTHLPGRVTRVASDRSLVDVQPLVRARRFGELGEEIRYSLPVVVNVPVMHPSAGGFCVTFPIAVGDTVLLAFSEASLDRWLAVGGEVDPGDYSRHGISDAVAILGLRDYAHKLSASPPDHLVAGYDGGAGIHFHPTELRLGSDAAVDPVALKSDLETLKALILAAPDGATFGTSLKVALNASPFPVCAAKVKAE